MIENFYGEAEDSDKFMTNRFPNIYHIPNSRVLRERRTGWGIPTTSNISLGAPFSHPGGNSVCSYCGNAIPKRSNDASYQQHFASWTPLNLVQSFPKRIDDAPVLENKPWLAGGNKSVHQLFLEFTQRRADISQDAPVSIKLGGPKGLNTSSAASTGQLQSGQPIDLRSVRWMSILGFTSNDIQGISLPDQHQQRTSLRDFPLLDQSSLFSKRINDAPVEGNKLIPLPPGFRGRPTDIFTDIFEEDSASPKLAGVRNIHVGHKGQQEPPKQKNEKGLRALRGILTILYEDMDSILRIVEDSGIDPARIKRCSTIIDTWHWVLKEAMKIGKIKDLIDAVKDEYGANKELQKACAMFDNQ